MVTETEFATERMNVHINRARIVLKLVSPDVVQDILARADVVGVLRQVFEQTKLNVGKSQGARVARYAVRGCVYEYVGKAIFHREW